MSTLKLTFRQDNAPLGRINFEGVTPAKLAGLTTTDIERLPINTDTRARALGDLFAVTGTAGDTLIIASGIAKLDGVAAGLDSETIIVDGDIGTWGGRRMTGGRLDVKGNAGPYLASRLSGGLITVSGNAGANVGGIRAGEKFGMVGGVVIVEGTVGPRAGDRMRRGTIIVRGKVGESAGSRMMGGTIWTETGFAAGPGRLLRRGTLIGPHIDRILPTFVDAGRHDLVVLRLMSRHMKTTLGDLAPPPLPSIVRKLAGDMATIGKGEILLIE